MQTKSIKARIIGLFGVLLIGFFLIIGSINNTLSNRQMRWFDFLVTCTGIGMMAYSLTALWQNLPGDLGMTVEVSPEAQEHLDRLKDYLSGLEEVEPESEPEVEVQDTLPVAVVSDPDPDPWDTPNPATSEPAVAPRVYIPDSIFELMLSRIWNPKGHVLITADTQTGKGMLVRGTIASYKNFYDEAGIKIKFWHSSVKKESMLGLDTVNASLDNLPYSLHIQMGDDSIPQWVERLRRIRDEKLPPAQVRRTKLQYEGKEITPNEVNIIFLEELQTCLMYVAQYDAINRTKYRAELESLINSFLLTGAQDYFWLFPVTQSRQSQNCGINTGMLNNLSHVVLGRMANFKSLKAAFYGREKLVDDPALAQELFEKAKVLAHQNHPASVCYTDLGGDDRVLAIPDTSNLVSKRLFFPSNNVVNLPHATNLTEVERIALGHTYNAS